MESVHLQMPRRKWGYKMDESILMVVDFPAPLGPINATFSPFLILKDILSTAVTFLYSGLNKPFNDDAFFCILNFLVSCFTSIMSVILSTFLAADKYRVSAAFDNMFFI